MCTQGIRINNIYDGTISFVGVDFEDIYKIEKNNMLVCTAYVPLGVCNVAIEIIFFQSASKAKSLNPPAGN